MDLSRGLGDVYKRQDKDQKSFRVEYSSLNEAAIEALVAEIKAAPAPTAPTAPAE
jgi:hypothetical protein